MPQIGGANVRTSYLLTKNIEKKLFLYFLPFNRGIYLILQI